MKNRPGRIDQAIEFPLPDESGREKLVQLYSCGLELSSELIAKLVMQTDGASAAFIKELLRRSAQFLLERDSTSRQLGQSDTEKTIDEMLHGSNFRALAKYNSFVCLQICKRFILVMNALTGHEKPFSASLIIL